MLGHAVGYSLADCAFRLVDQTYQESSSLNYCIVVEPEVIVIR
jgi:hypothetical protein